MTFLHRAFGKFTIEDHKMALYCVIEAAANGQTQIITERLKNRDFRKNAQIDGNEDSRIPLKREKTPQDLPALHAQYLNDEITYKFYLAGKFDLMATQYEDMLFNFNRTASRAEQQTMINNFGQNLNDEFTRRRFPFTGRLLKTHANLPALCAQHNIPSHSGLFLNVK